MDIQKLLGLSNPINQPIALNELTPNEQEAYLESLYDSYVKDGNIDQLERVLKNDNNPYPNKVDPIFRNAIVDQKVDVIKLLVEYGVDRVTVRSCLPKICENYEIFELVLSKNLFSWIDKEELVSKASINKKNLELLVKHGINLNHVNSKGKNVLCLISSMFHPSVIKAMQSYGLDVEVRIKQHSEQMGNLIDFGVDPLLITNEEDKVLVFAIIVKYNLMPKGWVESNKDKIPQEVWERVY